MSHVSTHQAVAPAADIDEPPVISVAGHELTLFVESAPMLARMAEDIRSAQTRVWLESYTFASDTAGRLIAEALIQRAKAGVDVRLLYDAIGSQGTSTALLKMMHAAGVKVHAFHSFLYALRNLSFFEILNRRNHRKLLVVDDRVAYFGGMNVVDTRPPPTRREQRRDLAEAGGWRDVHVRMTGAQVADVAESFERSWLRAHHQPIDRRPRSYRRVRLPRGERDFIRFYDSGPGLNFSRAERVFTRIIGLARRSVVMSMAYFLPTGRVLRTLNRVGHRGARLTLIVPGASDVPLVQRATRFLYSRLLERGVEIYERQRSMLHSKAMVVDDRYTVVGSCNLDPRSLEINLEFVAVIRSAAMAQAVAAICEAEIAESHGVTLADLDRHGPWQRFLDRCAYLLRRWL
ncbi:MAG TPA: phospholipase D-like domain-containing protein [Pirellulales bacterium]|nr:phospholipase D-like domain-containing protein [Pirellulales bacterium]